MVRTYKRKYTNSRQGKSYAPYQNYKKENLMKAIEAVKAGTLKLTDAAKKFEIPKSTLSRKYRNINCTQEQPGHPTLFAAEEEKTFVKMMITLGEWGFPFDTTDLRVFAQKYLNKIGKQVHSLKENMPGDDWARNFLERHKKEISNRKGSNISTDRAKITPEVIDEFFRNYTESVEGVTPDCIINYDETNLTDDPGSKKYIYKRGCKYPERVKNNSKTAISLMFAGTADGQPLPIYVVYKSEHLWDAWLEGGPDGTRYNRSKSGWFDSICFEDWFNTVILPYARHKPGRKILVGDNLSSHFSENVLKTCEDLNISFVCLPAKTTHLLQPLDVAYFAPLKNYWRQLLTQWKAKEGRKQKTLIKSSFPPLLMKLKHMMEKDDSEASNLIAGFDKAGLFPINPDRPKSRLPQIPCNEQVESTASSVIVEMLQELRVPHEGVSVIRRKKRCDVQAGKSITAEDLKKQPEITKPKQNKRKHKGSGGLRNTKKKSSINSAPSPTHGEISSDSHRSLIMTESVILPSTEPIAGPSGMCNRHKRPVQNNSHDDSDDEGVAVASHKTVNRPVKSYVGKGKGKGKTSKAINAMPAEDTDILSSLFCDTTVAKYIKKRARKCSDSSTSECDSDLMSIHSDSDIHGFITDENICDSSDDEGDLIEMKEANNNLNEENTADNPNTHLNEENTADNPKTDLNEEKTDDSTKTDLNEEKIADKTKTDVNEENTADNTKTDLNKEQTADNPKTDLNKENSADDPKTGLNEEKTDDNTKTDLNEENTADNTKTDLNKEQTDDKTKTDLNKGKTADNPKTDLNEEKIDDNSKTEHNIENNQNLINLHDENKILDEENLETGSSYCVDDYVVVRYFNRKNWMYYVGFIETIHIVDGTHVYTVKFFKTVKKPRLAFRKTRKIDRDEVIELNILKKINLDKSHTNPNELLLVDEEDKIYF